MKILQISNKFPYPAKDGGAIATISLSKTFSELGHEVTLLAMNTSKHFFDLAQLPTELREKINWFAVPLNTDLSVIKALNNLLFSRLPYNAIRFKCDKFRGKLVEILKAETFDVIQLEGLYVSFYLNDIRKYSAAHVSYRSHNVEHEIWMRTVANEKNFIKREYLSIIAKRLKKLEIDFLNTYDSLIAITQRDADALGVLGNKRPVHVTPTGFNTAELVNANSKIEFPSLFYIGALDWTPNQEGITWFIENCWKKLHKENPELNFYIAGRNAPSWLVSKLNQLGIVYLGEVEDAYEFMNSKAIMIVPLFSGSGMRIKIVEGLALSKTIISTSIGLEGIPAEHNKNILIADTPEEFIEQLKRCLENKPFFDKIGTNALRFVKSNFDNKVITGSLIEFYSNNLIT